MKRAIGWARGFAILVDVAAPALIRCFIIGYGVYCIVTGNLPGDEELKMIKGLF